MVSACSPMQVPIWTECLGQVLRCYHTLPMKLQHLKEDLCEEIHSIRDAGLCKLSKSDFFILTHRKIRDRWIHSQLINLYLCYLLPMWRLRGNAAFLGISKGILFCLCKWLSYLFAPARLRPIVTSWKVEDKYCQERKGSSWRNRNKRNFHLIFNETSIGELSDNFLICIISEWHNQEKNWGTFTV